MSFTPPDQMPFAVVEANFSSKEKYVAPISTKWLKDIQTTLDSKGNTLLKCKMFWPKDDACAYDLLMKHAEPNPSDTETWLSAEDGVTIFRFCRTFAEAKEGVEDAADLSSVPTQLKRSHKPNKKYASSDSEDYEKPVMKKSKGDGVSKGKPNSVKFVFAQKKITPSADLGGGPSGTMKPPALKSLLITKSDPLFKQDIGLTLPQKPLLVTSSRSQDRNATRKEGTDRDLTRDLTLEEEIKEPSPLSEREKDLVETGNLHENKGDSRANDGDSRANDGVSRANDEDSRANDGNSCANDGDSCGKEDGDVLLDGSRGKSAQADKGKIDRGSNDIASLFPTGENDGSGGAIRRLWSAESPNPKGRATFSPMKKKNNLYYSSLKGQQTAGAVTSTTFSKAIDVLMAKIDSLAIRVNAIYLAVCPCASTSAKADGESDSNLPTLPLASKENFVKFEEFISVEDQKIGMVVTLADIGGTDIKDIVYDIMKKLFTNKLACSYNMEGRNRDSGKDPKEAFKNLATYLVVHAAAQRRARKLHARTKINCYDKKHCDTFIAKWLKDAPKRFKTEVTKGAATDNGGVETVEGNV